MHLRKGMANIRRPCVGWMAFLALAVTAVPQTADSREKASRRTPNGKSTRRVPQKNMGRGVPSSQVTVIKKGTSSRESEKRAKAALPLEKIPQPARRRVEAILRGTSLYRELPTLRFEVDPNAYIYFAAHPDVAVSIWRTMGISKLQLKQSSPVMYTAKGVDGTSGNVEVLLRGPGHLLVICDGLIKNPLLFKPVKTKSLIHLQASFDRGKDGKTYVTHRIFLHVMFPSSTVEAAAKLLSPVSNMILDRNFREVSLFLHIMSRAMSQQPGWVERIVGKLDGIPEARRKELLKLTARVYVANRKRAARIAARTRGGSAKPAEQPPRIASPRQTPVRTNRRRDTRVETIRPARRTASNKAPTVRQ